ncbi:MAG: PEP-CTERM sorting domain-containing protein, partial [Verrucomicrobia bacterium]|nr:PEP-CTERM sorting domain-containing protein [Verrucomicrobiota bacterium]
SISMADGAVLRWEAGNTDDISGKLNPDANSNVVLKVNGGSVTFAMDIIFVGTGATASSATARVTKSGASDLYLTSAQSFTGGFTVNQGKLIATANGSLGTGTTIVNSGGTLAANGNNSSTNVDVNNGGILMGEGTLHAVNILTGGTLAPGASPGILITDSLILGANSNYQWQVHDAAGVAGIGWDKIMVTNNLNLSGVSSDGTRVSVNVMSLHNFTDTVAGDAVGWSKDDIHTFLFGHVGGITWNSGRGQNIADYFSFDTSAFTTTDNTGIGSSLWSMSYDSISGDITLTAVPEPSTYGFAIGALALAAAAIRRRKQKEKKV